MNEYEDDEECCECGGAMPSLHWRASNPFHTQKSKTNWVGIG